MISTIAFIISVVINIVIRIITIVITTEIKFYFTETTSVCPTVRLLLFVG